MSGSAVAIKRPLLLKIICIRGFALSLWHFIIVFGPEIKRLGDWMPAVLGIIVAANFISVVGIWYMKRWGVHLFVMTFFARLIFYYLFESIGIPGAVIGAACIIYFAFLYKRMDENL